MFSKKDRIKKADFKNIFKKAKPFHTKDFVLLYLHNPEIKNSQFSVIAGLKVGKAVQRNKAKRKVREILRQIKIKGESQIIVICKPSILSIGSQDLKKSITQILKEAKLLKS